MVKPVTDHPTGATADQLDTSLSEAARTVRFGDILAGRGTTTVALDEHNRLTRYYPDALPVRSSSAPGCVSSSWTAERHRMLGIIELTGGDHTGLGAIGSVCWRALRQMAVLLSSCVMS